MGNGIWIFLLTVLIFGVLIFVHELGHFIAARIFGVTVNEFAIGMGPKLFSKKGKKSGTIYSVRLLPIGGYNAMEGEDGEDDSEDAVISEGSFASKPVWQRMIIIVAGGFMNLLLGVILMFILVLSMDRFASAEIDCFRTDTEGVYEQSYVSPGSGSVLMAGDKIYSINGKRIHIGDQLSYRIFNDGIEPVDVVVIRDGERITLPDVVFPTAETSGIKYGVTNFYVLPEEKNFVTVTKQVFYGSINSMAQIVDSLKGMLSGRYGFDDLSGPIGVGGAVGDAASIGVQPVLNLVVLLAMNLGIFNLLPIPALDGGRFVFLLIEAIRRKPLPQKIEATVNGVGMMLLLGLVVVIAFKDVFMLIF